MKTLRIFAFCLVALTATRLAADDFLDQLDEALTMNAFHGNVFADFTHGPWSWSNLPKSTNG